ncbi:MAG TPA: pre-peptidase C-terminal domain-containing protein, partial [Pseudonocardia sp.]|nr:pre-peptidase C-terminal domain-containing protein [Pseudonocardia sp.]
MWRFTVLGSLRAPSRLVVPVIVFVLLAAGAAAPAQAAGFEIVTVSSPAEIKGAPGFKGGAVEVPGPLPRFGPGGLVNMPAQGFVREVEPNGTSATATPLGGGNVVAYGNVFPNGDVDFWSFTAGAGDRVYAATMTSFSANASTDSQLRVFQPDGTTLIEFDDDDGSIGGLSSSIAGAIIPAAGTYFLEVRHFSATNQLRPYELHFRLQSGAPTPETEPNDTPATANPLPASGWVSGARNPAAATEQDWYSFTANAGDTIWLSLDLDPENDITTWNGRLGVALFGDASNQILVVDDAGTVDTSDSESHFMTVKTTGMYFAFVDSAGAGTGGPTATYNLSVSIHPATDEGVNCTTYTSTDVPKTIGPGTGLVSSVLTVPGNPRIADVDVSIVLNHTLMADIDAHLRSPAGNDNGLFSDIGAAAAGGQTMMDTTFDDEAAMPPLFTVMRGPHYKPELAYRSNWFDGEDAGGTWTLDLRDDGANANGGTLTAWSLRICEPAAPPVCPPGTAPQTVFTTDFEADDGGFTHAGVQDEWERGLPTFTVLTTCNSGVNCWVTDLDNTYNASANNDLFSPAINLAGRVPPVIVNWAHRHQVENATFDHYSVDIREVGNPANSRRFFEWLDATPTDTIGNPAVTINESSGWGTFRGDASSFAGLNTELRFHFDSDTTVQLAGVAIDDVSVTACRVLSADLSITKTDGVATATPGGSVTYTITASNAGPDNVVGATVADTFPAALTCTWTCVGAGGGTCTAGPVAGNIHDLVNQPAGGSVTYTATCNIALSATGSLVNTATVASAIADPNANNNSATDTDTLTPTADLAITKTDGVATATPGGSVTYTIVASNAGPSNAPSATVADTFPAALTCTWTCVGAGGGTCTAGPVPGNINDAVSLPAGGSVTYTATCNIAPSATGTLVNTATVASPTA